MRDETFRYYEWLAQEYRMVNHKWRNGDVTENITSENLDFYERISRHTNMMHREVKRVFRRISIDQMRIILSDLLELVQENQELFKEYYLHLKHDNDADKFDPANMVSNHLVYDSSKTIYEHSITVEKFLIKFSGLSESDTQKPIEKLKWLGKPAQFGWVFLELARQGFIELPTTNGNGSYAKYAKVCMTLFDIDTKPGAFKKNMNPESNKLTDTIRAKFTIPDIKDI